MRHLLLFGIVVLTAPVAVAQDGPPRVSETVWTVTLRGKTIGTETVREGLVDGRRVLSSKGDLQLPGAPPFKYEQQVEVGEDGAFVRYQLKSATIACAAEVTAEGAKVSRTYMGNTGEAKVKKGAAPFVILDNLVWSHYELLGRRAVKADGPLTVMALVPQGQVGLEARFDLGEALEVQVGDGKRNAKRGILTVGGQLVALTYDAQDGTAYRVEVPAQQFDCWVQGFVRPDVEDDDVGPWREEDVHVPAPQGELPGTLTLPLADVPGPYPVAVLVHGSGPNDRNESVGPNRPFRDLAHGLARRGIATLRYDKRTFLLNVAFFAGGAARKRAEKALETLDFDKESIEDAVAALAWLEQRDGLGARFLIGHSLGAMAAPHVASRHDGLSGLVLLAGPGRGIDVLICEQMLYKASLTGKLEEGQKGVSELEGLLKKARTGELPDSARIMGGTVFYWKSLFAHEDVPAALAKTTQPVLLLQGAADYQVTKTDYELLKAALESRDGAVHEARLFDGLNHLFMKVEGKSTGAEYMIKGRMEAEVIDTVATWIARTAK